MSSERAEQLLRQILANPDDLAVRAVYADELQAAGDPRGEFIALELANDPALAGRRIALLARHARQWWPELPRHCIATRNGFVERVAGSAQALGACVRMFATEPVRDVEVISSSMRTFPHAAWPAHVRRVAMRGSAGEAFEQFVRSDAARTIAVLDASGSQLRDVAPLGEALPACRQLVLADNASFGRRLPTLLDWRHVGALEVLDVRRTTLVGATTADVLRRDLRALRVLQLSGNPLGEDGARVLAAMAPRLPALERVELLDCELPHATIALLRDAYPPHVQLAFDIADLGDTFRIDALATRLDVIRLGPDRWSIEIDGVRRSIRWREAYDTTAGPYATEEHLAEIAPLDRIGHALACGAARSLDDAAERAMLPLGRAGATIYGDTLETDAYCVIEYSAASSPISIRFSENVVG